MSSRQPHATHGRALLVASLPIAAALGEYLLAPIVCSTGCAAYMSTPWLPEGRVALLAALAAALLWEAVPYAAGLLAACLGAGCGAARLWRGVAAYLAPRLSGLAFYGAALFAATGWFVDHYGAMSLLYDALRLAGLVAGYMALLEGWRGLAVLLAAAAARLVLDPLPPLLLSCGCLGATVLVVRLGGLLGTAAYVAAAYLAAWRLAGRRPVD